MFVELPEVGATLEAGTNCAVVESVKAASDVYCALGGEVMEVNDALVDSPELVNSDPYGEGWLWRLSPEDATQVEALMDATAYRAMIES